MNPRDLIHRPAVLRFGIESARKRPMHAMYSRVFIISAAFLINGCGSKGGSTVQLTRGPVCEFVVPDGFAVETVDETNPDYIYVSITDESRAESAAITIEVRHLGTSPGSLWLEKVDDTNHESIMINGRTWNTPAGRNGSAAVSETDEFRIIMMGSSEVWQAIARSIKFCPGKEKTL